MRVEQREVTWCSRSADESEQHIRAIPIGCRRKHVLLQELARTESLHLSGEEAQIRRIESVRTCQSCALIRLEDDLLFVAHILLPIRLVHINMLLFDFVLLPVRSM